MMRSSSSMYLVRQLSSVVLPEPVPPEISTLARHAPDDLQDLGALRRDRAELDQLVERQLVLLELANGERGAVDRQRRHDGVDARAVGRRASQIGEDSSTRRPTWLTMRWQMLSSC
jgi:hypothetical protein